MADIKKVTKKRSRKTSEKWDGNVVKAVSGNRSSIDEAGERSKIDDMPVIGTGVIDDIPSSWASIDEPGDRHESHQKLVWEQLIELVKTGIMSGTTAAAKRIDDKFDESTIALFEGLLLSTRFQLGDKWVGPIRMEFIDKRVSGNELKSRRMLALSW